MKKQKESNVTDNKIRVIHILQSAGGVAEYLKDLLNYIDKSKYENIIIVSNDYKSQEETLSKKCDKIFYVDMVREIEPKKDFSAIIKIRKIIKQEKPDILYLHSSKAGALGRIATFFNRKIKVIYNAHGWYFNADIGKKKKILFQLIERILAYRTDKIIAISKSEYDSAIKEGICKEKKLVLIENGIDIDKYSDYETYREDTRKRYGIKENDIVVGIVGRVSEQKDPITSIKAAAEIIKQNKDIYFMFVGSGDLEKEILNIAKENNIESNVFITGWVENVKEYISAFDIALLPSKWEGFGLAIVEYMICKKPIITTKAGGISNILDKSDSAFFIERENHKDIVNSVYNILSNENIDKMIERNYQECKEKFSIRRVAKQTETLINELYVSEGI